ncbi:Protein of unknown function DUF43 [Amycolatopsis arida]|uniref:N(4)-bis(aminopropyl)spermidine synthase C-terminal domain-containing protein n=1 Tax=Amycolatopsis arida TaxID=587909 RepID=A0A1I5PG38_9PSEU|nr:bis-aminopropyl spermidine synthase family protein [Amycolatopsis arida]TDX98490.1 uncharacterized protein DUF43 [Amycolatopsis arida]SFP33078.1 Protein of unknown function DUF43 [Amycolatopsis arida]
MHPLDELFAAHGVATHPLRLALARLAAGWWDLDALVLETAAPRRSVQELLAALDGDLDRDGDRVRLRPSVAPAYERYQVPPAPPPDPDTVAGWIAAAPPPLPALDHVPATPETVVRRARWLDERYDLRNTRLVFLGDHDLTSLAVRALRPEARLTVVDVDDRVLEYVDRRTDRSVRTVHADLRIGLPPAIAGGADLVFSDPPYTPEGMGLFAARGVECLAEPARGHLLLAYGYSPRHPALGAKVQRALAELGLVFAAILPGFHRYTGAQAIGGAADLYVCQPTGRPGRGRGKGRSKDRSKDDAGIYTHGPQSVEAAASPAGLMDAVTELADGREVVRRRADWSAPVAAPAVALDLGTDPGPWLLRALLAVNADRLAVLVPNRHPDLADAAAQAELRRLVAPKYRLRLLRSTPDGTHAVVLAEAAPAGALSSVWTRAHGKLGNTLREALAATGALTRNAARQRATELVPDVADLRLLDLPRHRIAELLAATS